MENLASLCDQKVGIETRGGVKIQNPEFKEFISNTFKVYEYDKD